VEVRRDLYPLEEIVGTVLQRMEPQLQGRAVSTDLAENLPAGNIPTVFVDDVLLGQVLWNLLENAAKYTPPGTPIELAASEQDGAVIIEVRDRGPGVPPGEEERIFEKFYRAKSGNARGAGLGLPICRAIVEAHRGTIQALPRAGGGAVFRIGLPREAK
jgi:two-component system sensor histidine kinase KdpD